MDLTEFTQLKSRQMEYGDDPLVYFKVHTNWFTAKISHLSIIALGDDFVDCPDTRVTDVRDNCWFWLSKASADLAEVVIDKVKTGAILYSLEDSVDI